MKMLNKNDLVKSNDNQKKYDYGEILFIGKCNYKCYYCLCNEMKKMQKNTLIYNEKHFSQWPNFSCFLNELKVNQCKIIYLSSTSSEPLLYKYIDELVDYLKDEGFRVGIRTNGTIITKKLELFKKFDDEISISLNSLNVDTNMLITRSSLIPDWKAIFEYFTKNNIVARISIVIVRENYQEIEDILDFLSEQKCVGYVQLRKKYNYYNKQDYTLDETFDYVKNFIEKNCKKIGNYFESPIYKYKDLTVSLWFDVFKKESLNTLNYFIDGVLTSNNLLVEAYEEDNNE